MPKDSIYSKGEQAFLDAYRNLESALSETGSGTVPDREQALEASGRKADMSKLRVCRNFRNFIVHDGPGFAGELGAMAAFLEGMSREILRNAGTAADAMSSPAAYGAVRISDPVEKAARVLARKKRGDVLVLDASGALGGVLRAEGLAACLAEPDAGWTLGLLASKRLLFVPGTYVRPEEPCSRVPADRKVLVRNVNGKLMGVLNPEKAWAP